MALGRSCSTVWPLSERVLNQVLRVAAGTDQVRLLYERVNGRLVTVWRFPEEMVTSLVSAVLACVRCGTPRIIKAPRAPTYQRYFCRCIDYMTGLGGASGVPEGRA